MYGRTGDIALTGLNWSLLGRRIIITFMIVLTIFTNTFIVPSALADPTSAPSEKAEGVFGEGTGGLSQPEPDSKTGAMTWTYPFSLPAARGGPQPKLALSYNSSSHDREAGYGWGLDLPVIERKPLSGNPCFAPDGTGTPIVCGERRKDASGAFISEERYTYNGQPLVFICQLPGSKENCGDEPQPEDWIPQNGWRYFRLQVEGQFARFYLSENRRYWRVQLKGGELLEFGEPPNSGTLGIEHALGNKNAVLRWRLVRHSDAMHKFSGAPVNYVDYRWKELGKRGLLYLTDIYDTPRANGPSGAADFAHHTQLTWDSPDFPQTFYADPYRATPDLRLSGVAVASATWSGFGPREVIRTYLLNYASAQRTEPTVFTGTIPRYQIWHHSFLSRISSVGRCNYVEDDQGNLPFDPRDQCRSYLPSTTFEYEAPYSVSSFAAFPTQVQPDPLNVVDENRVLPYLDSVGVVDFNRDGLPDIVQSWNSQDCPNNLANDGDSKGNNGTNVVSPTGDFLMCDQGFRIGGDKFHELVPFQSARPILGYLNRGSASAVGYAGYSVKLDYQCMDAGRIGDPTGLTDHNAERIPGFFTNNGATTLLGSWGEGVAAWSNAKYAPYRAKPLLLGSKPSEFKPGTGCNADNFNEKNFHPGWKWEKTQDVDWAKLPFNMSDSPQNLQPRWFTDIDGDGLTDRLESSGEPVGDFERAYIEFTQRYAKNHPLASNDSAVQIPFVFDFNQISPQSLAPSVEGGKRGTKYFYVDINGDGLVDLVTYNFRFEFPPQVRPGDGKGHFSCDDSKQSWSCLQPKGGATPAYEIDFKGPPNLFNINDKEIYFHDVTGDGLADLVKYDMSTGGVRLWVNQDGHTFACVTGETEPKSCAAGFVQDQRTGTFNIGDHRMTFADMNADGTDDIVILANRGAYVVTFMNTSGAFLERAGAPKPGLLVRIHNGYGATTDIQYQTIQKLDLAVKDTALAWEYHSPVVESVVTQVITQDSYHANKSSNDPKTEAPYQFKRKAQYLYQNPAYDRWSRSFVGFRKVIAHYGDEKATTATTYWFGPCQNNRLGDRLPNADVPFCLEGSDDNSDKSSTGRVVRIDRGNDFLDAFVGGDITRRQPPGEGPKLLWTKIFQHTTAILFTRPDRRVAFSYPSQIDTYLYDDAQPTQPGGIIPVLCDSAGCGDPRTDAPHQKNIRKHLRRKVEYDDRGTLKRVTDNGAIIDKGESNPIDVADTTTITLFSSKNTFDFRNNGPSGPNDPTPLTCTSDWECLPDFVSIWEPEKGSRVDATSYNLLRKSRFTYNNATKDIQSVEGWLERNAEPLDRRHPAGTNSIAPKPSGQSLQRGWHRFATLSYDNWGNVTQTVSGEPLGGSPPTCTTIAYDDPYQHLPNIVRNFKDGCTGKVLETQSIFDRGFEQVVSSIAPNGSSSEIRLDPFGRTKEVYLPNPDATAGTQKPVLAATIDYSDRDPLSHVDVQHIVGSGKSIRSVTILNGLGEPVVAFDQGDNNDWILNGWTETNLTGQVEQVRRPWKFTGDPIATAENVKSIPVPSDNSSFKMVYDGFGRRVSVQEKGSSFSQELMRTRYFPLAIETRDAEQIKPGGIHEKAFQRVEFDGHGRSTKSVAHIKNPITEDIVTTVKYEATGEPGTITRTHAGSTYERSMVYDSLGRLMVNKEPNTGNNWRYVWDDTGRLVGTSDARGCGVNYHYDGLSRLIGEDYSPCLASQPDYTAPNFVTGEGFEAFNRYDEYETDQVSPEPTFTDDAKLALGNLVSVSDRGSHTRFNYDARNRVRRISRQVAKPEALGNDSPYAPHWFTSRLDYDLGDRLTRRTTGVDVPELILNGGSEERYAYSPRGQISSIESSYGAIVKSMAYDPDGAPRRIVYGDSRNTAASFAYDNRRRLTQYKLATPSRVIFGPFLQVEHFDFRFSGYDDVGNLLTIEDRQQSFAPGRFPRFEAPALLMRNMQYDDLYRLTQLDRTYNRDGFAPWRSPFDPEISTGDRHPVPLRSLPTRVKQQTFDYDGLGNITASSDDLSARYDRSLGSNLGYGTPTNGPNQLQSGEGLQVRYDVAGNLTELKLERTGNCPTGAADQCAQWFAYDWDEVGQLARARRWDFDGNTLPPQAAPDALPVEQPSWDLTYAYSQGARVRKSATDAANVGRHTLEIFDTLRVEQAPFNSTDGNYEVKPDNVQVYPAGMAHAFWDADGTLPHQSPDSLITMHLVVGDHLGSSSVVINHATSDLVESTTYQPYGAVESDYRASKWKAFREPYKLTGKEEDIEVGATYFGARYYQPYLGRFMSADPLTIHGLGSDLNPYAYVGGRVMSRVDPFGLDETPEQKEISPPSCLGLEDCTGVPDWIKELDNQTEPSTEVDAGTTVPQIPQPLPNIEPNPDTIPFWQALSDPRTWSPRVDPAVIEGFNAGVTKNQVALVGTGITAAISVAVLSGAAIYEAGALLVGGIESSLHSIVSTAYVNAAPAAQAFTNWSLAEQGIAVGGGGALIAAEEGGALFSTRYAGRVGPGRFATASGRIMAKGSEYASTSVRERILAFMRKYGCHTCGTKIGSARADHQPPNAFNPLGFLQWFYPQCASCSSKQGNEVKKLMR
jgi:RHS repeat-associated protein